MFCKILHFLQLPGVDTALSLGKKQTSPCPVTSSAVLAAPRGLGVARTTRAPVREGAPGNVPADD